MKATLFLTTALTIATIIMVGIRHHSLLLILVLVGAVGGVFLSNWNKDEEHTHVMLTIMLVGLLTAILGR